MNKLKQYLKTQLNLKLISSIENNNIDEAIHLIKEGADVLNNNGSALYLCTKKGHLELLKNLLDDSTRKYIHKIAEIASNCGHLDIIKFLVKENYLLNYQRMFEVAIESGHLHILKYILESMECHFPLIKKDTSIMKAAKKGDLTIMKYLLEGNLDLAIITNDKILIETFRNKHLELAKYLVNAGMNIHTTKEDLLNIAISNDDIDSVNYLISKNIDVQSNENQALIFACEYVEKYKNFEIIKILLRNGADIHSQSDESLRTASENGNIELVKFLVENGANINAGTTQSLKWAIKGKHLNVVKYLIENGADFNSDTMISLATKHSLPIVKYLVEKGADINIVRNSKNKEAAVWGNSHYLEQELDTKNKQTTKKIKL